MFERIAASPGLAGLVTSYWFIQDFEGAYAGRPIPTAPIAGGVLTVNIGRSNAMLGGPLVPRVGLTGVQTSIRHWVAWPDTYFVMAMLTPAGVARLFPGTGESSVDTVLEVAAAIGDGPVRSLAEAVSAAWEPIVIGSFLDGWFLRRLRKIRTSAEIDRYAAACAILEAGGPVEAAARQAGVTRRQLYRWSQLHAGVGPKNLADISRLQSSLAAMQTGQGDALQGYSDQAHQIRSWRRRLGVTPGSYSKQGPSDLVEIFGPHAAVLKQDVIPFYM